MPVLLLFVLIVVLIAQIGFWDTLAAILGAFAMALLLAVVLALVAALAAWLVYRRVRGGV